MDIRKLSSLSVGTSNVSEDQGNSSDCSAPASGIGSAEQPAANEIHNSLPPSTSHVASHRSTSNPDGTTTSGNIRAVLKIILSGASFYRIYIILFGCFALPALIFTRFDAKHESARCLYMVLAVLLCWISNCIDACVVSLFPVILCPMLGITSVKVIAAAYVKSVTFLLIGASLLAAAMRRVQVDTLLARQLLSKLPSDPAYITLGVMFAASLLSMWVNNASATLILCPVVDSIFRTLDQSAEISRPILEDNSYDNPNLQPRSPHAMVADSSNSYDAVNIGASDAAFHISLDDARSTARQQYRAPRNSEEVPSNRTSSMHAFDASVIRGSCDAGGPRNVDTSSKTECHLDNSAIGIPVEIPETYSSPFLPQNHQPQFEIEGYKDPSSTRSNLQSGNKHEEIPGDSICVQMTMNPPCMQSPRERIYYVDCETRSLIFVGLAYGATLGGMATLNGSIPNTVLIGVLDSSYAFGAVDHGVNPVNFGSIFLFCFPLYLLTIFFVWICLIGFWLGPRKAAVSSLSVFRRLVTYLYAFPFRTLFKVRSAAPSVRCCQAFCISARFCRRDKQQHERRHMNVEHLPTSTSGPRHQSTPMPSDEATSETVSPGAQPLPTEPGDRKIESSSERYASVDLKFARTELLVVIVLVILTWMTRSTGISTFPGWGAWFKPGYIDDSIPVLVVGCLLFVLPLFPQSSLHTRQQISAIASTFDSAEAATSQPDTVSERSRQSNCSSLILREWRFARETVRRADTFIPLLDFAFAKKYIEWDVILLLGGGFALAAAVSASGLDNSLAIALGRIVELSPSKMVLAVTSLTCALTQFMSSTAAANVILPVLVQVAHDLKYSPLLLLLPATIGVQFAFLLPISTAPNAIIFRHAPIKGWQLFITGILAVSVCIPLTMLAVFTWGCAMFDLMEPQLWSAPA